MMKKIVLLTAVLVLTFSFTALARDLTFEDFSVEAYEGDDCILVSGELKGMAPEAVMLQVYDGDTLIEARTLQTIVDTEDGNSKFCVWEARYDEGKRPLETGKEYTLKLADFAGGKWYKTVFSVITEPKPDDPQNPEGGDDTYAKPAYTGTWDKPVTDGKWQMGPGGYWTYSTNAMFRNTWAYIQYTDGDGKVQTGWFYFDKNGIMLTGWQKIGGVWYYLNAQHGGTYGMCLLNTVTPDGYRVDANGAWIP